MVSKKTDDNDLSGYGIRASDPVEAWRDDTYCNCETKDAQIAAPRSRVFMGVLCVGLPQSHFCFVRMRYRSLPRITGGALRVCNKRTVMSTF